MSRIFDSVPARTRSLSSGPGLHLTKAPEAEALNVAEALSQPGDLPVKPASPGTQSGSLQKARIGEPRESHVRVKRRAHERSASEARKSKPIGKPVASCDASEKRLLPGHSGEQAPASEEQEKQQGTERKDSPRPDAEPVYPTKGTKFFHDPNFRKGITNARKEAREHRELEQQAWDSLSIDEKARATLVKTAAKALDALMTGSLQKDTAKGNAYAFHGAVTDARTGGLVTAQTPSGAAGVEAYGITGIAAAVTSLGDVYQKTTQYFNYQKKLKQLVKALNRADRDLQKLLLEKADLKGDPHAAQALLEYQRADEAAFEAKRKKALEKNGKILKAPVEPERERDKYPNPTGAQLAAALEVEIKAAKTARDKARTALRTHTSTLFKERGKVLRDVLVAMATASTSTAWGIKVLSDAIELAMTVAINTSAIVPVMSALNVVGGSVDQYESRKDRNAASAAIETKVMPRILAATEALGHYEQELLRLPEDSKARRVAAQNRNAAECALRCANRDLRVQLRLLRVAQGREIKGRLFQAGGVVATLGLIPGAQPLLPVGLGIVSVTGGLWWSGPIASNAVFRKQNKKRGKARQAAEANYIAEQGVRKARNQMQSTTAPLGKKGNVVRQFLNVASGGRIHAMRDAQPVDEENIHLNEYVAVTVYAHDLLAGPEAPSYQNAKCFLLKLGLPEAAFDAAMGLVDAVVEKDKQAGTYVEAGHIEVLKKVVAPVIGPTLYDPKSLTNETEGYKAADLFGRDFLRRFDIQLDKADNPTLKQRGVRMGALLAKDVEAIKNAVNGSETLTAKSFLQREVERKRAERPKADQNDVTFDAREVSYIAHKLTQLGFNVDDVEDALVFAAERCPEAKQAEFYAQPEVRVLTQVIDLRYRDDIDQSAFEAFLGSDQAKGVGTKLPKVYRAIADAALSVNKFDRDRRRDGLSHYLDCINLHCDLAKAGITIADVEKLKLSLEQSAKGKNTKKRSYRKPLAEACAAILDFNERYGQHVFEPAALLGQLKGEEDAGSPGRPGQSDQSARARQERRAAWVILARVERAFHKEFGKRRLEDGDTQPSDPVGRAAKRASRQFFKQQPTDGLNAFPTENRWTAVRNHLAADGIEPDDLLRAFEPLQAILRKTFYDHAERSAAQELWGHLLTAICPPVFGEYIVKIMDSVAEMAREIDLSVEVAAQLPSTSPVIQDLVTKLANKGIGTDQLLDILKSQDALPEASRMPPALRRAVITLLGAAQARQAPLGSRDPDQLAVDKNQKTIRLAKVLTYLGRQVLWDRLREEMRAAKSALTPDDIAGLETNTSLLDICLKKGDAERAKKVFETLKESGLADLIGKFQTIQFATAELDILPPAPGESMVHYEAAKKRLAASADLVHAHLFDLVGQGLLTHIPGNALPGAWEMLRNAGIAEGDWWGISMSFLHGGARIAKSGHVRAEDGAAQKPEAGEPGEDAGKKNAARDRSKRFTLVALDSVNLSRRRTLVDAEGESDASASSEESGPALLSEAQAELQRLDAAMNGTLNTFIALWDARPSVQAADKLHHKMLGKDPAAQNLTAQERIKLKSELPVVRAKVLAAIGELYPPIGFRNKARVGIEERTVGSKYDNRLAQVLEKGTELDCKLAWMAIVRKLQGVPYEMSLEQIGAVFTDLANAELRDASLSTGRKLHKKSDFGRKAFTILSEIHRSHAVLKGEEGKNEIKMLGQFLRLQEVIKENHKTVAEFNKLPWQQTVPDPATMGEAHRVWASLAEGKPVMNLKDMEALIGWIEHLPVNKRFHRVLAAAYNLASHPSAKLPPPRYIAHLRAGLSKLEGDETVLKKAAKADNEVAFLEEAIKIATDHGVMLRGDIPLMNPELSGASADAALDGVLKDFEAAHLDPVDITSALKFLGGVVSEHPEQSSGLAALLEAGSGPLMDLATTLDLRKSNGAPSGVRPRQSNFKAMRTSTATGNVGRIRTSSAVKPVLPLWRKADTSEDQARQSAAANATRDAAPPVIPDVPRAPAVKQTASLTIANGPRALPALRWERGNAMDGTPCHIAKHPTSGEAIVAFAVPAEEGYYHDLQQGHQCTLHTFNNMNMYLDDDERCLLTPGYLAQVGMDIDRPEDENYSIELIMKVGAKLNSGRAEEFNFRDYEGASCYVRADQFGMEGVPVDGADLNVMAALGRSADNGKGEVELDAELAPSPCAGITFAFATKDAPVTGAQHTVFVYRDIKNRMRMGSDVYWVMDSRNREQTQLGSRDLKSAIAEFVTKKGQCADTGMHQVDVFFPSAIQNG